MTIQAPIYCLDANVLIEAWNKYYSPEFCDTYWEVINELGKKGRVFIPRAVHDEIVSTDDKLAAWVKSTHIPVKDVSGDVTSRLNEIFEKDPKHERLVDSTRGRSLADPWVIAHALHEKAIVVTKEEKVTDPASNRVKIPNVCEAMGVEWMNDFDFIRACNIRFTCAYSDAT